MTRPEDAHEVPPSAGGLASLVGDSFVPAAVHREEVAAKFATITREDRASATARLTDAQLIELFIEERASGSEHTVASYRAQLRRLGWFCFAIGLRSVRELMREHWGSFGKYLRDPPAEHVMAGASVGFGEKGWRPFRGPLKDTSARQAEVIVKGFYDWMADPSIGAIEFDPVKTWKTHSARKSRTKDGVDRLLSRDHLRYVDQAIDAMPCDTEEQLRMRARARWICCLALNTGLRASEIARASSAMLRWGSEPGGRILRITRKGAIESDLPLLDEVVNGYRDYLAVYGLEISAEPDLPLVMPLRVSQRHLMLGGAKHLSRAHVWKVMRDVLTAGADVAAAGGDMASQEVLLLASTHWLRHTFANDLLDSGVDIRAVRDLLDHGDISTTNTYLHKAQSKLRGEINKLKRARGAA